MDKSVLRPAPLWKVYSGGQLQAVYAVVERRGKRRAIVTAHLLCVSRKRVQEVDRSKAI